MSPAEASSLHGKCQFAITAPFGKVGRSVLILLRERWHQPNPPFWLPPALRRGLHFLLQLVRQLPDFVVSLDPSPFPPVLVWSDAMYNPGPMRA